MIVPTPGIVARAPIVNGPVTPAIVYPVTVNEVPSGSESFVNTLPETAVSSVVVLISFVAIGASFTAATTMSINPVSVPPFPSETV